MLTVSQIATKVLAIYTSSRHATKIDIYYSTTKF